ncbi:hypothetical protein XCAW_b00050 (plasmid) [Xanthomonas citri subsp. citri Aw12879]|nr:hypothetical protein XCAW_b00050 [Xanthomonas citri subsp. citri Aw12879]
MTTPRRPLSGAAFLLGQKRRVCNAIALDNPVGSGTYPRAIPPPCHVQFPPPRAEKPRAIPPPLNPVVRSSYSVSGSGFPFSVDNSPSAAHRLRPGKRLPFAVHSFAPSAARPAWCGHPCPH